MRKTTSKSDAPPTPLWIDGFSLPDWAKGWLYFGFRLSELPESNRWIVAVSVPDRAFVSCLIAAGISVGHHMTKGACGFNTANHLEWLSSLPIGSPVRFIERPLAIVNHQSLYKFLGVSEEGRVCLKRNGVESAETSVGGSGVQLIRDFSFNYPREQIIQLDYLMKASMGVIGDYKQAFSFAFPARPLGAIIGRTGHVYRESELDIDCRFRDPNRKVKLNCLLGIGHRCLLFSNASARLKTIGSHVMEFAVFDHFSAMNRHFSEINHKISIHLLDRSRSDYWEYRDWVYHQFINRRETEPDTLPACPSVETLLFSMP